MAELIIEGRRLLRTAISPATTFIELIQRRNVTTQAAVQAATAATVSAMVPEPGPGHGERAAEQMPGPVDAGAMAADGAQMVRLVRLVETVTTGRRSGAGGGPAGYSITGLGYVQVVQNTGVIVGQQA